MDSKGRLVLPGDLEACAPVQREETGLCYVDQALPGYRREREGDNFAYFNEAGNRVTDPALLERFKLLVIPPAWENVWISPAPGGHIQATGRDKRKRKQYLYHAQWEEIRGQAKFERMLPFGDALPIIRRRVEHDLKMQDFSRQTALAFAVRLLEETLIRIGNPQYARQNSSYGITTLQRHHVSVSGGSLQLHFKGKGGKPWDIDLRSPRLARLARQYQELPGQALLQYRDDGGRLQVVASEDVNAYLKALSGDDFTAKDFRTWGGTVQAAVELVRLGPAGSEKEAARKLVQAIRKTAGKLGNTPSTCRRYYVHPSVIEAFRDTRLFDAMAEAGEPIDRHDLTREEKAVITIIGAAAL